MKPKALDLNDIVNDIIKERSVNTDPKDEEVEDIHHLLQPIHFHHGQK